MKFFKVLVSIILLVLILLSGGALYIWNQRIPLLEKAANQATLELFEGTLRLKDVSITKDWRVEITGVTGKMKTETGSVPLTVEKLETQTSLAKMLLTQRSEIRFHGFQPVPSQSRPISGLIRLRFGHYFSARINSPVESVFIKDYAWLNPAGFEGVNGTVSGDFMVRIDSRENAKFNINLHTDETGGEVPARFLNFALPYLPPSTQNSKELKKLIASQKKVRFSMGLVEAAVVEPGKIQAKLKMIFPEQNLNLNLNLTIIVDENHAFFRAFKLLGLLKINAGAKKINLNVE